MPVYDDGDCIMLPQVKDEDTRSPWNGLRGMYNDSGKKKGEGPLLFPTYKEAQDAVVATLHFMKAHWPDSTDKFKDYRIVPVYAAPTKPQP